MARAIYYRLYDVYERGPVVLMGYAQLVSGYPVTATAISSLKLRVFESTERETPTATQVIPDDNPSEGLDNGVVTLNPANVIQDVPVTNDVRWSVNEHEGKGYNFLYVLDGKWIREGGKVYTVEIIGTQASDGRTFPFGLWLGKAYNLYTYNDEAA